MSGYIPYTDEQKHRANHTDLVSMLRSMGETLKREGNNYRWVSGHDSLMVRGCEWYQNSRQIGGKAIDFCSKFLNMDFRETMQFLLNGEQAADFQMAESKQQPEQKPFELPAANNNMRRVFAYLTKERCIDGDVVSHFAHAETIYEDAQYHNVVFVGRDENGAAPFASKRGTLSFAEKSFRRDVAGSDKSYGFCHVGITGKLLCFESPVDMLSYISLHKQGWQEHSYIALGGVSDKTLLRFLKQHENISEVCLCLDNDRAGLEAIQRIGKTAGDMGYTVSTCVPRCKDWNEQLQQMRNTSEQTMDAPTMEMRGVTS